MATASLDLTKKSMTALAGTAAGNEFVTLLNQGAASALASHIVAGVVIATSVSQTVDWGVLNVGDIVVKIHVSAGTAIFYTVVTIDTLPVASVIGDLYLVLRPIALPAASAVTL